MRIKKNIADLPLHNDLHFFFIVWIQIYQLQLLVILEGDQSHLILTSPHQC